MNRFLIICLLLLLGFAAYSQAKQKSADELKKEMAQIRQNTDWSDQAAADSAQVKIEELSKQLMMIRKLEQQQQAGATVDSAKLKEEVDYKMQMWSQMINITDLGKGGKWDLAKPFREEIVEEYKEDENPTIKNPVWRDSMPDLTINMSQPQVQVIIDQMTAFRGIRRLIIICEKEGTPVNLDQIIRNAAAYPLEELYILNFGTSVTSLPSQVGDFKGLRVLSLLNNDLNMIPSSVSKLSGLKVFYTDMNPVEELLSVVGPLKKLEKLGVAETNISDSEINQIHQVIPNCEILR